MRMPSFYFIQFSLGYHFFRSFFSDLYRRLVYVNPLWPLQIPQNDQPVFLPFRLCFEIRPPP